MAQPVVFLDLTLFFDPSESWSNIYEFDKSFNRYLNSIGLEAEVVETVRGSTNRRIMVIKKKPLMPTVNEKMPIGRPKFPGNKIRSLGEKK